ncbi:MAG TPA: cupin domain-containing protein [Bacillales bacterium]|nr:cupin domain-containing protein [Bacillales bacterium]
MDIKNIRQAQVYDEQHLKKVDLFHEKESSAFVINLMPGQSLPAHRHPGHQVYLMVFEGEGECSIDENRHHLAWRDVLRCGGNKQLSLKNSGRKLMSVYVVLTK